jgi:AraC-like DNA-binding protein
MRSSPKRRDGFQGEKLISLPQKVIRDALKRAPSLFQLFITHIGYFPRAYAHYRERRKGCEDNILIYCVQGKGHFVIENKRFEVTANQFIHLPATDKYMRYWADTEDPWSIYWIHFSGHEITSFNDQLGIKLLTGPQYVPFNQKALDIWETIYQSLELGYSIENLCNASFCLYQFIATFSFTDKHIKSERKEVRSTVENAIINLKGNIDQKLTVSDMARMQNLSSSHFSSLFRKATGMSPIGYFIHLKMQRACQLLYTPDVMIKTVAMDLGYDDQYYFSRIFKKHIGMSPEQYRWSFKNNEVK